MQGFRFLQLDQEGRPSNHGTILSQITPEWYLCQFSKTPTSCRVMRIEALEVWHFFPNEKAMNNFISHIVKTDQPPQPVPDKVARRPDNMPATPRKKKKKVSK